MKNSHNGPYGPIFWPYFSASLRDPQICSDLHEFFFGVHSNIVEWDNPVAVNPQEPFANLSHPSVDVSGQAATYSFPTSTNHIFFYPIGKKGVKS